MYFFNVANECTFDTEVLRDFGTEVSDPLSTKVPDVFKVYFV